METPLKAMFRSSVPGGSIGLHRAKPQPETPARSSTTDAFGSPTSPAAAPTESRAPQLAYHSTVGYDSADRFASEHMRAAAATILERYEVPEGFEVDKVTFGPLAGQSRASRLVVAHGRGLLPLKPGFAAVEVCSACGASGHVARRCGAAVTGFE